MPSHPIPLIVAVALVAGPLLAGLVIGRAGRRLRWWWLPIAVGVMGMSLAAVDWFPAVGAWDLIAEGFLLTAALSMGAAGADGRALLVLAIASAVGVLGLEWAARRYLPSPPSFPPPEAAVYAARPDAWDVGCSVLYGAAGLDGEIGKLRYGSPSAMQKKPGRPLVVHLGDSMTFGDGVAEDEAFPALLDAGSADVVHANYGVWAVGTDFEYLLLQKILAAHAPALVVLHVYVGNDIFDVDRPYECCAAGPLVDYRPEGPVARCPEARWRFTLASRFGHSPAPYPLRVATGWSYAARHTAAAFAVLGFWLDRPPNFISPENAGSEEGWEHLRQLLTAMRDQLRARGSELAVTLLPTRTALQARDPSEVPTYRAERRAGALAAELGIRTLDAWNVFAAAVQHDGAARYFLGEHDIHFSPAGHRLVADWLARELGPVPGVGARGGQGGSAKKPNGTSVASSWNVHTLPSGKRGRSSARSVRTSHGRALPRNARHSGRKSDRSAPVSVGSQEMQAKPR